jgi:hypothetical protein
MMHLKILRICQLCEYLNYSDRYHRKDYDPEKKFPQTPQPARFSAGDGSARPPAAHEHGLRRRHGSGPRPDPHFLLQEDTGLALDLLFHLLNQSTRIRRSRSTAVDDEVGVHG